MLTTHRLPPRSRSSAPPDQVPQRSTAPAEVVSWLKGAAVPLKTVEAGHGFKDLEPLRKMVGNARVVGLGEATHGTREFFQMKHRVLEFLVREMGFNVFAIEASWPDCLAINDYVLHGKGDPVAAIKGQKFWTWSTEEVLALVEWMRAYNADATNPRNLQFIGYDMQIVDTPVREVLAYLRKVDPEEATRLEKPLGEIGATLQRYYKTRDKALLAPVEALVKQVSATFDAKKAEYIARSSAGEYAHQRREALSLQRSVEGVSGSYARDRCMADNLEQILREGGPDTKIVSWAHNFHTGYHPGMMGSYLRDDLGDGYEAVGFGFGQGSFQAIDAEGSGLREFTLGPPPKETLNAALQDAGKPLWYVDLHEAPAGTVATWLAEPRPVHDYGSVFSDVRPERYLQRYGVANAFDDLIYVDRTTRARPLP